ncbi:lytic polysaccharide monooxygenase [Canariomyces notabilis]|uniref:lytic cellulose monooxygenase (C4-dehydrogenating) n=1 Tax=Canariomyces notabilis TaxID=2074819 RepID=A0AAN6TAQ1_9PEZI|nr:lytic polysaccharide monooxygenase [Canariomyces arenarius]
MKLSSCLAAVVGIGLTPGAAAHQVHGILIVNGTASPPWKYVRDVSQFLNMERLSPADEYPKTIPQGTSDLNSSNITCGRRAFDWAAKTETADVLAGSEVGFRVSWSLNCTNHYAPEYACGVSYFYHDGPGQIYLSRAPNDDLESYEGGDGDWFKIAYAGPASNSTWTLRGTPDWNFTIPATTPPGKYLMRIEQFWPTGTDHSQWFINCAHINIIGPGGGTPTGFAKFPGTYQPGDPGFNYLPRGIYGGLEDEMRLLDYRPPGPELWTG